MKTTTSISYPYTFPIKGSKRGTLGWTIEVHAVIDQNNIGQVTKVVSNGEDVTDLAFFPGTGMRSAIDADLANRIGLNQF